jgi:hypothetical protein
MLNDTVAMFSGPPSSGSTVPPPDPAARRCHSVDFDYRLCLKIMGSSTLLAFALLAIPLGFNGSMSIYLFILNQVVYNTYSFLFTRYIFEFTVPGMSKTLYYCVFGLSTILGILFYILRFMNLLHSPFNKRTVPPLIYVIILVLGYLYHAWQLEKNNAASTSRLTIQMQPTVSVSPLRTKMTLPLNHSRHSDSVTNRSESTSSEQCPEVFQTEDVSWNYIKYDMFGLSPSIIDMQNVFIIGSTIWQWIRACMMLGVLAISFVMCQSLIRNFDRAGQREQFGSYLLFSSVLMLLGPMARYFGYLADQSKTDGPSMEILMEMAVLYFYYAFYLNLFISVGSYWLVFLMEGFSVFCSIVGVHIDFSAWYLNAIDFLFIRYKDRPLQLGLLCCLCGSPSSELLVQRQCFRTGMKFYLFLNSVITFVLFSTFLRYGYNNVFYCVFDTMNNHDYSLLMQFTMISLGRELLVLRYTDGFCMAKYRHGILTLWEDFLTGSIWGGGNCNGSVVVFMIWLMTHISTDIYLSQIDLSTVGGSECSYKSD